MIHYMRLRFPSLNQ
ncbi:erythromycin resistance leader peptide [Fredinandcohnia salidurans]|uniref:Erythromycin resistance leader peptide n=1 Tax=Fredinandcohnia salidurans TaxID=2595041 RepID=A0ABW4MP52_9BACI